MLSRQLAFGLLSLALLCGTFVSAIPDPKKKQESSGVCQFEGDSWKKHLTPGETVFAGAFARLCAQTILHPMDTMRTRRQAKGGLKTTPKDWLKGIIPQMALAMPAGALQFVVLEDVKERLKKLAGNNTLGGFRDTLIDLGSAAVASGAASLIRVPQERIKQPVQADIYENAWEAIKGNLQAGGLTSFYTGFAATILRDIPWNTLSTIFLGRLKELLKGRDFTPFETAVLGGIAGAIAAVIMTPVDVVKTRLMLQKADAAGILPYQGILHCLLKVAREEGPSALMKGVTPRIGFLGPLSAVTWAVYDALGKALLKRRGANWCKKQ